MDKPVFVLRQHDTPTTPVEGAVFAEWTQFCRRKDVRVFIQYKRRDPPTRMSPVMVDRTRPWLLMSRSWCVIGTYGSLQAAVKAAQQSI